MGKGKHWRPSVLERLTRRRPRLALRPPAPLEWVDLRTIITHLLTPDAAAAGRVRGGRYIALCGAEVIPAGMTEPGPSTVTDPTDSDDTCPGCGAHGVQPQPAPPTVAAWSCTACGLHWCTTVVNPTLRVALSVVGLLPTPQHRSAALLAVLQTEVTQRAQAREHTMTVTVRFPLDQVVQFDAVATVDTTIWSCRICGQESTATTTPQATSDALAHLGNDHGGALAESS